MTTEATVLLRELRVQRPITPRPVSRYQERTQTSQVLEDGIWRDSWDSRVASATKKADIETGEDQKGT